MTDAILNRAGKQPSLNDSVASRAISFAKMSTDDLMTDVGMLSITDDFAGIALVNLLTSSSVGGSRWNRGGPECRTSDCSGSMASVLVESHRLIAILMLRILLAK